MLQTLTVGPPDSSVGLRFSEYHFFINDNWRVRPDFTLDYGLRYEYNSVPRSADKRIERALTLEVLPPPGNSRFNTQARTDKFRLANSDDQRAWLWLRSRYRNPGADHPICPEIQLLA